MQEYVVAIRTVDDGGDFIAKLPPEELQKIAAKYDRWFGGMVQSGRLISARKLKDGQGKVIRGPDNTVTDGPYVAAAEVVGGVFVIKADSYDDAVMIVADSPALAFGGVLEIREADTLQDASNG